MFQTFDAPTNPTDGPPRLDALRDWMKSQGLDGFIVPRADKFQGEYVAVCDERLSWLTGFTGSAGFACVLQNVAGVFIDGRYRIQVKDQVADCFTPVPWPEISLTDWLKEQATNAKIGFDPWLHTVAELEKAETALDGSGIALIPSSNAVDAIWSDRPDGQTDQAFAHPLEFSGESSRSKIVRIAQDICDMGCDAFVLTQPDSVNWLLNIRGSDIPKTPIVQAYAIVHTSGRITLICNPEQFTDLGSDPLVDLLHWDALIPHLQGYSGTIGLDPTSTPVAIAEKIKNSKRAADPCSLPKACKNETEVAGARQAHIRDAAAYCEFLAWFANQDTANLSEIDVVIALEQFRTATGKLHDISFDTISGSGPNGAIVHYRVTHDSNRPLDQDSVLLVDSGGQYQDGTTDITRTLPLGTPPQQIKAAFTRVLKGMIGLSQLRFPKGLAGRDIDVIARAPLWSAGQDYDHGTGHGVGSFLSVHEGPQRVSRVSDVPFQTGMIVSNEPGYYKEGEFGIRIENLIVVQDAPALDGGDARSHFQFETLTLVPIDTTMIVTDLLTADERNWINSYHQEISEKIGPFLSDAASHWLDGATQPI